MKSIFDVDKNMLLKDSIDDDLVYYNPIENRDIFNIYGMNNERSEFTRFSQEEREYIKPVNESVEWLSKHTAGINIKFRTDSMKLVLDVKLPAVHDMSHMAATGQCGFDLYVYEDSIKDYVLHNTSTYNITLDHYRSNMLEVETKKTREYILNFPLYMGVENLYIGLEKGSIIEKSYYNNDGRVVLYGTSIAQGGCASRPGMCYTNILSRWLDIEFLNYGFSGSAFLEKEIAYILRKIDNQKLFIIDTEANAGCDERMEKNLERFIDIYRETQKNVPIILVSRCHFAMDYYSDRRVKMMEDAKEFLKRVVRKYKKLGVNIRFLDGSKFFKGYKNNFTEFTVDGVHPTDLGMYHMALSHYKLIKKML